MNRSINQAEAIGVRIFLPPVFAFFLFLPCFFSPRADAAQQPFYAFNMMVSTLEGKGDVTVRLKEAHSWNRQQALDPVAAARYNALGHAAFKQNDFKTALLNFENARRLDCNNPEYAENTGFLLLLTGQYEKSVAALLTSLEISPGRASVWYTLGKAYSYLEKDDLAYACIVNACMFSKKRENTLAFVGKYAAENPSLSVVTPYALDACSTIGLDGAFRTRYPGSAKAREASRAASNALPQGAVAPPAVVPAPAPPRPPVQAQQPPIQAQPSAQPPQTTPAQPPTQAQAVPPPASHPVQNQPPATQTVEKPVAKPQSAGNNLMGLAKDAF